MNIGVPYRGVVTGQPLQDGYLHWSLVVRVHIKPFDTPLAAGCKLLCYGPGEATVGSLGHLTSLPWHLSWGSS